MNAWSACVLFLFLELIGILALMAATEWIRWV
jgi:hypothetical protein